MFELCVVIRFLLVKMATEIHRELVQMFGENCINVSNVRKWKRDFENNHRVSLADEWHSRWPVDGLTVDNIHCVCEILKADDHFTLVKIVV